MTAESGLRRTRPLIVAATLGAALGLTAQHFVTEWYVLPKWKAAVADQRKALDDCRRWVQ